MRRELRWTLGATLLLSAAALWWPQPARNVVGALDVAADDNPRGTAGVHAGLAARGPLPNKLEPLNLEPARRDPFSSVAPPAPAVAAAPVSQPLASPPPVAPVPLTAPPLTLRYLGRLVTPDGRPMVLLARGDTAISVQPGMMLDEGYRVQHITAEAVRLLYPPTGAEVDLPIPPAPTSP